MQFRPQRYAIADEPERPFIDPAEIWDAIRQPAPPLGQVRDLLAKSLAKERLTLTETAALINAQGAEAQAEILDAARTLKQAVYGNRIVLFAPLYIGSHCSNECAYCGFRQSNATAERITLSDALLRREVQTLVREGQKRLILVYGEHRAYSPEYIAHTAREVYSVREGHGQIRRVNINAAPQSIEGFRTVASAGVGTYQIFQETYHPEAYARYHLWGRKRDYAWRLTALDRAQLAGLDDVGIGALFGLYDWRFEVLALVRHTNHLEACFNVGPHTISFPRFQPADAVTMASDYLVTDTDFQRLVAILRLAVPYTGLILTAREPAHVRNMVMACGVSQIDAGTHIGLGGYSAPQRVASDLSNEQFTINDQRSLAEVVQQLLRGGDMPSFCTACYRLGRTGEHFMEFSVPGFIKRYCTPNALLTLAEYLTDYASEPLRTEGFAAIAQRLSDMHDGQLAQATRERLEQIRNGARDLYF